MNHELEALQNAINVLHNLMTELDDPGDTATVAKCLSALTNIQQKMMQENNQARQSIVSQLGQSAGY